MRGGRIRRLSAQRRADVPPALRSLSIIATFGVAKLPKTRDADERQRGSWPCARLAEILFRAASHSSTVRGRHPPARRSMRRIGAARTRERRGLPRAAAREANSHSYRYDLAQQGDLDGGHVPPAAALPAARPLHSSTSSTPAPRRNARPWLGLHCRWRSTTPRWRSASSRIARRTACCPTARRSRSPATTPRRRRSTCRRRARRARRARRWCCSGPASPRPTPSRRPARCRRATPWPRSTSATATPPASATAPMQIGRLNLRLMLARDASDGYATLGVAPRRRAPRRQPAGARHPVHPADAARAAATPILDGYAARAARPAAPARRGAGRRG